MMKSTTVALAALLTGVNAGNLCIAGTYKPSKIHVSRLYAFAAGHACEDGKRMEYSAQTYEICNQLPQGINICGQNANLIKIDHGPDSGFGCQIGLEVDGTVYEGEVYGFNPDDGNAHKGPCDASCGLNLGLDGYLQYVGVPLGFCN